MDIKQCTDCKLKLNISEFYKDSYKKDGYKHQCKKCITIRRSKNNKIGIYKITSPTNKVYVGQSRNLKKREKSYYNGSGYKYQTILKKSICKYGWENHIFEIIEECEFEKLNIRERYWQDYYDVLGEKGLNCILTETDNLPRIISKETKEKIIKGNKGKKQTDYQKQRVSEIHKGKKVSKETIEKFKKSIKKFYEVNESPNLGFKHSEETKKKMSEAQKGKILTEEHKAKIGRKGVLNKNYGRVMPEHQKEKLRGERPHMQGKNNHNFGKPLSEEVKKKLSKLAKERYENNPELREAISNRMSGEKHRQWGIPIGEYQKSRIREANSKLVLNLETGIFCDSVKEASEMFNINYSTLRRYLNGYSPNKSNLTQC